MDTSNLPKTRAEAKATGAKYYFTGEPCKHGHISARRTKGVCLECARIEFEAAYVKRADYFKQYSTTEASKEAKRRYYEKNRETVIARAAARPVEERRAARKVHKNKNPDMYKVLTNERRRRHKDATPRWVTKEQKAEMRALYTSAMQITAATGVQYVVDHIVPLLGDTVSGLHVPWNLRVITQEENLKKSNKHDAE